MAAQPVCVQETSKYLGYKTLQKHVFVFTRYGKQPKIVEIINPNLQNLYAHTFK